MFNDVAIDSGLKAPERRRAFASIRIMQDSTRTTVAMGDLTINNTKASFWALPDELVVQVSLLRVAFHRLSFHRTTVIGYNGKRLLLLKLDCYRYCRSASQALCCSCPVPAIGEALRRVSNSCEHDPDRNAATETASAISS